MFESQPDNEWNYKNWTFSEYFFSVQMPDKKLMHK